MTATVARTLAATYPPPVKARWGADLATEIASAGPRGWLDAAVTSASLWLRPAQWPAPTGSQLRRAVVVLTLVTVAATGLAFRGAGPLPSEVSSARTMTALALVVAGLCCLTPLPRCSVRSVRAIARATVLPGITSAALLLGLYLIAQLPLPAHGGVGVAQTAVYWLVLGVVAGCPAVAICRLDPHEVRIPGHARTIVGLTVSAAGQLAGGASGVATGHGAAAVAVGCLQCALGAVMAAAVVDLRRARRVVRLDT